VPSVDKYFLNNLFFPTEKNGVPKKRDYTTWSFSAGNCVIPHEISGYPSIDDDKFGLIFMKHRRQDRALLFRAANRALASELV
jgi:hypothetical protein